MSCEAWLKTFSPELFERYERDKKMLHSFLSLKEESRKHVMELIARLSISKDSKTEVLSTDSKEQYDYDMEFETFPDPETEGSYKELWKFARSTTTEIRRLRRQIETKNKIIGAGYDRQTSKQPL